MSNYLADPDITGILKGLITASILPLKVVETSFAVDSSGFSTCRFVRWFNKKYGREVDNREWVKVHLMCGGQDADRHGCRVNTLAGISTRIRPDQIIVATAQVDNRPLVTADQKIRQYPRVQNLP